MAIAWKPGLRIDIDPDARKDWTFDFASWVPTGAVIASYEILHASSVTVDDDTISSEGAEITFWVSDVAEGATEIVTVRVTLDTGLVDDFSLTFRGRQQ
jgi:hypothetical protein